MEAVAGTAGEISRSVTMYSLQISHGCSALQEEVGAQLWFAYVPAGIAERSTAVRDTLEQIDAIKEGDQGAFGCLRDGAYGQRHRTYQRGWLDLLRFSGEALFQSAANFSNWALAWNVGSYRRILVTA
jgi:hypothetical protein